MNTSYLYRQIMVNQSMIQAALDEWRANHREDYYLIDTRRQRFSKDLAQTQMYSLRRVRIKAEQVVSTASTKDTLECVNSALVQTFPAMMRLIDEIGAQINPPGWSHLGRAFVTRLNASSDIGRHTDEGRYFDMLHRIHVPLESDGQARFCWDNGESISMNVGEVWEVNNSVPHWVTNAGAPRTHLIFDAV